MGAREATATANGFNPSANSYSETVLVWPSQSGQVDLAQAFGEFATMEHAGAVEVT